MATAIEICSNAFVRLGAPPISSFTEGGAQGVAAANLYEPTLRAMLSEHRWRFASAKRTLARLTATPLNDWSYAFQLPSDLLVLYHTDPNVEYQIYEDKIYANVTEMDVDYQMRPNEGLFPPYFQLALEYRLASEFALIVTSNRSLAETYELKAVEQMKKARFADAQQSPAVSVQSFDYLETRS
jgi:hypothetical protein